jgi:hypothetical protein
MNPALENAAKRIQGIHIAVEKVDPGFQPGSIRREVEVGAATYGLLFVGHGGFRLEIGDESHDAPDTREPLSIHGVEYRGYAMMSAEGGMHITTYDNSSSYRNHPNVGIRRDELFSIQDPTPAAQQRLGIRYKREGRYDDGLLVDIATVAQATLADEWDDLDKQATERADLNDLHSKCQRLLDKLEEAIEVLG